MSPPLKNNCTGIFYHDVFRLNYILYFDLLCMTLFPLRLFQTDTFLHSKVYTLLRGLDFYGYFWTVLISLGRRSLF